MAVKEGRDRQSGERRSLAAPRSGLLPASQILQDSVNLFLFAESLKERQQVQQLCVIHVIKPGLDWHLRKCVCVWGGCVGIKKSDIIEARQRLSNSQHSLGGKCKRQVNCRQ